MESIDDLLAQVKAELEPDLQKKNQKKKPPYFISEADLNPAISETQTSSPSSHRDGTGGDRATDNLLRQLKAELSEQEQQETLLLQQQTQIEKQRQEQELRASQLREQQKQERKRQALRQEAEVWLKKLHPNTEEGRWFEEFSYNYSTKLEAAIDYLAALKETKAHP